MLVPKKMFALAAGSMVALSAASFAEPQAPAPPNPVGVPTLVLNEVTIDWIEKSDVAALREGVIEKLELTIGKPVIAGGEIGHLHRKVAELSVKKAQLAARAKAPMAKAKAQYDHALAVLATSKRLNLKTAGSVSSEQLRKEEAEVNIAEATQTEAQEKTAIDVAELELNQQILEEHTIRAPIDGVIIEVHRQPGESIRANEAVVRMGNLARLRAFAYVPVDESYKVKEGQLVDLQPVISGGGVNPFASKVFRGKVTFIDPRIQPIGDASVRIYAEFENPNGELRPGLKARMTIHLTNEPTAAPNLTQGAANQPR
ncbi:efflux RND transporter periplasmic adaptor subunit [Isosphaeraceae bacterium EP7]